jgi:methylthioribose-1-phosphate isomerase
MAKRTIAPIRWAGDRVALLDQTRLPQSESYLECGRVEEVAEAIRGLRVRGAPLIGIAAAYGIALAARGFDFAQPRPTPSAVEARGEREALGRRVAEAAELLRATRPTARNLCWAIDRMLAVADSGGGAEELLAEARAIHEEDARTCRLIGEHGAPLIGQGAAVLTICNTGSLATGGEGTALAVIRHAHRQGKGVRVLACETRPLLQGARLTMWELRQDGIPATLITDAAAGTCMQRGMVNLVITGADCIARNGDAANKVGTYPLAVLAKRHGIPFYVAAPMSSVDLSLAHGSQIPIEERDPEEVRSCGGHPVSPAGVEAFNPAFDVTPAELISGIITERGVAHAPYERSLTGT